MAIRSAFEIHYGVPLPFVLPAPLSCCPLRLSQTIAYASLVNNVCPIPLLSLSLTTLEQCESADSIGSRSWRVAGYGPITPPRFILRHPVYEQELEIWVSLCDLGTYSSTRRTAFI